MESTFPRLQRPVPKPPAEPTTPPVSPATRMFLMVTILLAVCARFGLYQAGPASDNDRVLEPDSARYVELARNLVATGTFGKAAERNGEVHPRLAAFRGARQEREEPDGAGLRPEILRTPGYPAFIAALLKTNLDIWAVLVAQNVLSVLSLWLVFAIGRHLLQSNWAAAISAAIVALHPADVLAANTLLAETVFTFTMLLGLFVIVWGRDQGWLPNAGGGLLIGVSALVRPVSIFLGPVLAVWLAVTERNRRGLIAAAVLLVSSLLPATAWMARNANTGFGFRISSIPYINAWFYTSAYMNIKADEGDFQADWPAAVRSQFGELQAQIEPEEETFAAMRRLSFETIRQQPMLYASVLGRSFGKFFSDHSMPNFNARLGRTYEPTGARAKFLSGILWPFGQAESEPPHAQSMIWPLLWTSWNVTLALLMVVGLICIAIRRQWSVLFLLAGVFVYFLLATQANGLERFRLPVLGVQALMVGAMIAWARTQPDSDDKPGGPESRQPNEQQRPIGGNPLLQVGAARATRPI